tara:strand:+ start:279 stop:920 length:642 start_codon:yes stop_codon:yes gene_type:complete
MKDNFIETYKNALSNKSCDYIVNCFNEFKEHVKTGKTGSGKEMKHWKDSWDLNLMNVKNELESFLIKELKSSLKDNIDKYVSKYHLLSPERGSIWKYHSIYPYAIHAKRYEKNVQGYHIYHADISTIKEQIYRTAVCMYYLNDVSEGGETEFYHQKVKIKPEKGTLVIFPAYFTHLHKGNVPISNDKYILNFWLMKGNDNPRKIKDLNGFTLD